MYKDIIIHSNIYGLELLSFKFNLTSDEPVIALCDAENLWQELLLEK